MNDELWDRVRGLSSKTWKGCEWVELLVVLVRLKISACCTRMSWYGWNWYLRYRCLLVHWTGEEISMGWQADSRIHWMTSRSMNPFSYVHQSESDIEAVVVLGTAGPGTKINYEVFVWKFAVIFASFSSYFFLHLQMTNICFILFLFLSTSSNDKYLLHFLLILVYCFKWQIFAIFLLGVGPLQFSVWWVCPFDYK